MVSAVGKELVMMDIQNGNYVGLNETGRAIWELIETPVKVSDLVAQLAAKYSVTTEECMKDTLEYLDKMNDQQLLLIH